MKYINYDIDNKEIFRTISASILAKALQITRDELIDLIDACGNIKRNIDIVRHKNKHEFFNSDNRQRAYRECWTVVFSFSGAFVMSVLSDVSMGNIFRKKCYSTFKIFEKGTELDESDTDFALDDEILLDEGKNGYIR